MRVTAVFVISACAGASVQALADSCVLGTTYTLHATQLTEGGATLMPPQARYSFDLATLGMHAATAYVFDPETGGARPVGLRVKP